MFDDRNVSPENQKLLWQHYYDTLAKGVDAGYNPTVEMYDPALAHSLKYDIAKFSAFKETSFRKQLESALTKNGKVVPWSEFKKNADVLNTQYNRQWLKTEYNHTVATANMAQQWQGFEADKDLYPNLRYNAVNDARTRDQHKAWDGLILPIEHVFWKSHLPPNDWGCRCDVEQSDDKPTVEMPEILIKGAFNNNAALSGKVFNEVPYASGLSSAEVKDVKVKANKYFDNAILQKPRNEQFKELVKDGKGRVVEHLLAKKGDDYTDILTAAKEFAKKGKVAELMPEIYKNEVTIRNIIFPNLQSKTSNPDLKIGSLFYDIKRPKAIKNIVGNANKASNQGAIAIISNSQLDKPLTELILKERVKDIFKDKNYLFNEVAFLIDGKLVLFNRTSL